MIARRRRTPDGTQNGTQTPVLGSYSSADAVGVRPVVKPPEMSARPSRSKMAVADDRGVVIEPVDWNEPIGCVGLRNRPASVTPTATTRSARTTSPSRPGPQARGGAPAHEPAGKDINERRVYIPSPRPMAKALLRSARPSAPACRSIEAHQLFGPRRSHQPARRTSPLGDREVSCRRHPGLRSQ
jgi:hypothetical protein